MTLEELIKTIQIAIAEAEWNYPFEISEALKTDHRNRYSKLLLSLRSGFGLE